LNNIFRKTFLLALCFFCFAFPAFAQGDVTFVGDDDIGLDLSFQFVATRSGPDAYNEAVLGVGGRVGYYLGSIVFLDVEALHQPSSFSENWNKKTIVLGGFRFGTIFDDWIGVFAKARAGAFFHYEGIPEWPEININSVPGIIPWNPRPPLTFEKETYPVIDIGVVIERYFEKHFFVRMDIGDWIIPLGNKEANSMDGRPYRVGTTHNFAVEFGLGFRF
jgi:hypothetical protein